MIRSFRWAHLALVLFLSAASDLSGADTTTPADVELIVVVGADGTDQYGEQFRDWVGQWTQVATRVSAQLTTIGQATQDDPSDRQRLKAALEALDPSSEIPIWIVLIGHGTFAGNEAKFNLRGPDVSATEMADWVKRFDRPMVIVNCTSSSGPFINQLSGPKRVIVTATKSGSEQNFARFGQYFAEAVTSADSDLDHDHEVSVHEAFLRASADVEAFYDSAARISTEHALIDDNGDGLGTPATRFRGVRPIPSANDKEKLDGKVASRMTLSPSANALRLSAEAAEERNQIENQLDQLRLAKESMSLDDYLSKIEPLMIRLAIIYQAAEGGTHNHLRE
ncbi:hypothetical protein [Novipirellula artificiosorum]|nr:hypothetical protein [Novipirellula artificiosorum]